VNIGLLLCQYAAVKGISQVVLSRITIAAPGMCELHAVILHNFYF